jgi:hypothetical protein
MNIQHIYNILIIWGEQSGGTHKFYNKNNKMTSKVKHILKNKETLKKGIKIWYKPEYYKKIKIEKKIKIKVYTSKATQLI